MGEEILYNRRVDDKRINEILVKVAEIHQRQELTVMPDVERIKKNIYGNGKPGCMEEHIENKIKISALTESFKNMRNGMWAISLTVIGFIVEQVITRVLK